MAASDLVNLSGLMDDVKCVALVRQHRWPEGVRCPGCESASVIRDGYDDIQPHRQRYRCTACASRFDDLTGTVLAGHKGQPAAVAQRDGSGVVAGWQARPCQLRGHPSGGAPLAVARWKRTSHPSSA
jgi:DNA-directed RNA polymerase subunit RPC12/RpoP